MVDVTADDAFAIWASDGVWEFIESQEAVNIVAACTVHVFSFEACCLCSKPSCAMRVGLCTGCVLGARPVQLAVCVATRAGALGAAACHALLSRLWYRAWCAGLHSNPDADDRLKVVLLAPAG